MDRSSNGHPSSFPGYKKPRASLFPLHYLSSSSPPPRSAAATLPPPPPATAAPPIRLPLSHPNPTSGFSASLRRPPPYSTPPLAPRVANGAAAALLEQILEQILDEHEERRHCEAAVAGTGESAARDLVDVLLQLTEEKDGPESEARLTRDGVKAFVQDIIAGGTESSAVTMEWAMSELLRRPDALAATTDELDRVVGHDRWVTEPDLHRRRGEGDDAAAPGGPAPRPAPGDEG